MNRLYQKSPLGFSLFWIAVYVVGTGAAQSLSELLAMPGAVTAAFHAVLCGYLLLWLKHNGLLRRCGFCKPAGKPAEYLWYLPLAALSLCNVWVGFAWTMPLQEALLCVCSMLCVGVLEEVIFRGFLFRAMYPEGIKTAVLVSGLTFGAGHIVNVFNASAMQILPGLCQVSYAAAFGILFAVLLYKSGSLLACIAAHCTVNVLGVFVAEENMTPGGLVALSVVMTLGALLYAYFLWKKKTGLSD